MVHDVFKPSLARQGFDMLLARYPHLDVLMVDWGSTDPAVSTITNAWVLVTLGQPSESNEEGISLLGREAFARWEFAIWKNTGNVYSVDHNGAVSDDPIIVFPGTARTPPPG